MMCRCCSADVAAYVGAFCDVCGRIVSQRDLDAFHTETLPPRGALEEERFDLALREGGG